MFDKIGIIVAMREEMEPLKQKMVVVSEGEQFGMHIYEGEISEATCVLVLCGIGKVNGSRAAQYIAMRGDVDCIISVGTAGALVDELNYFDFIISENSVQWDFDLTVFGREKGEIPGCGRMFKADERLVEIAKRVGRAVIGTVVSADTFCNIPKGKTELNREFGAICDDMETAAIAQVCDGCGMPYVAIRCITDKPINDTEVDFYNYLHIASEKCAEFIKSMVGIIR